MIINKGIVQGSIKPPEWDLDSSKVTIYHRTNIMEIQSEQGTIWEYNEEQMTTQDYAFYVQEQYSQIQKENMELKTITNDLLLQNLKSEGAIL